MVPSKLRAKRGSRVFLEITTTHQPATDLDFLLHKNPARLHEVELAFGKALLCYPEATGTRCTAALILDIDPVGLVRGKSGTDGLMQQYVNVQLRSSLRPSSPGRQHHIA